MNGLKRIFGIIFFLSSLIRAFDNSEIIPVSSNENPLRTVLYLGGGDGSAWYHLGVLYALRDYRIPIDSIVASSWGVWIGSLVSSGWELDDVQRLFLEPEIAPFLTKDLLWEKNRNEASHLSFAESGNPALQWRISVQADSDGKIFIVPRNISLDSLQINRLLFKLRVEESLLRAAPGKYIPLSVASCKGNVAPTYFEIYGSFPFPQNKNSGEICAPVPYPREEINNEMAIVSIASPFRISQPSENFWKSAIRDSLIQSIEKDSISGVILRPYRVNVSDPKSWMQAGYESVEKKRGDFSILSNRIQQQKENSQEVVKDTVFPRFRFHLSVDSISSEIQTHIRSFWTESDTGIDMPRNFILGISKNPIYDSLNIDLNGVGDFQVNAVTDPLFDIYLGGFGSNIWGPNAFGILSFRYINQFEYLLLLKAFYGLTSYGISPELHLLNLWEGNWNLFVRGVWTKWTSLKGFLRDIPEGYKIYSEEERNYFFGFDYHRNLNHTLTFQILIGESEFETEQNESYGSLNVKQMYPHLIYRNRTESFEPWFGNEGYSFEFSSGLKSVYLSFDAFSEAPLYLSSHFDFQKFFSPHTNIVFGLGTTGALNIRRRNQYPEPLYLVKNYREAPALTNYFRGHAAVTPWSEEWPFVEFSSHHYIAARTSTGIHFQGAGFWLFAAYLRDFEHHLKALDENRFSLEGMFRFQWKSLSFFTGMTRTVGFDSFQDIKELKHYLYFIQIGMPLM